MCNNLAITSDRADTLSNFAEALPLLSLDVTSMEDGIKDSLQYSSDTMECGINEQCTETNRTVMLMI